MTTRQVLISDIGPISRLEIPIPEGGGVVVLRGRNGLGKTTALNAAASLMDGETDLTVRDGEEKGSVVGLGCEISVKKRTARAGTLEVQRIAGEDPALLVDPGIKDPAAADKARIRALCRLARVKQSRATFAPLETIAGMPLPITLGDDLPESAGKTKRAIEMKAREVEESVARDLGRVEGLLRNVAAIDLTAPHDEALLASAATKAVRELASIEGEASAYLRASQDAERAREALDMAREGYKGPKPEAASQALGEAQAEEQRLQEALAKAREARIAAAGTLKAASDFESACKGWEETIAKAENAFGVSEEQVVKLRKAVQEADAARDRGVLIRQALQQKEEADKANAALTAKRLEGEKLREAAAACDRIVSEAISSVAPAGLKIQDGRLIVAHRRGEIPFEELSHGERWTVALDVAIDAVGPDGLLSIAQDAWESLDPENRALINEHAKRRKAVILTAEASLGELKAEVVA